MAAQEKTAFFRCDASPDIGSGHVMRCLTLAESLSKKGWRCAFLCTKETPAILPALATSGFDVYSPEETPDYANFLIVDHYGLDQKYEASTRLWARKIIVLDDLADRAHNCDLLLDQTYGRSAEDYRPLVPEGCRILTGAEYALLRPQFPAARPAALARRAGSIDRVLISFGNTNIHNITTKALEDLSGITSKKLALDVVLGSRAPYFRDVEQIVRAIADQSFHAIRLLTDVTDMASLMTGADFAVGAGGTTSWERCCLGLPALIIEIADNQRLLAARLHKAGAAHNLGWHENIGSSSLARTLETYIMKPDLGRAMAHKAAALCDGRGLGYLADIINKSYCWHTA